MKKLILPGIVLFLLISCATYTPVQIDPVEYSFEVPKEKDDIFISANNWMVENFIDAKSVIQFSDKEAGVVTGKYLLQTSVISEMESTDIFAVIKIQVKDGASRITIIPERFYEIKNPTSPPDHVYGNAEQPRTYGELQATSQISNLIASYEQYVKNDTSGNW